MCLFEFVQAREAIDYVPFFEFVQAPWDETTEATKAHLMVKTISQQVLHIFRSFFKNILKILIPPSLSCVTFKLLRAGNKE